ncbi:hypothetical protein [Methylorubrum populi]
MTGTSTPVLAAIVIPFFTLLGAAIGFFGNNFLATRNLRKEISVKVAEYRLQWINELGEQFADFAACTASHMFASSGEKHEELFKEAQRAKSRIITLMNIEDDLFPPLDEAMTNLSFYAGGHIGASPDAEDVRKYYDLQHKFLRISNDIVKKEWRKTKTHLRIDTVKSAALASGGDKDWIDRLAYPENS